MCELYFHNMVILKKPITVVFRNACLGSKIIKKTKEVNSIEFRTVVFYGRKKGLS